MDNCPIPAFPKIWSVGSPELRDLFKGPVEITEKIDGSQFAFGNINGELVMRSKGRRIYPEQVDGLFKPVVEWVKTLELNCVEGLFFYGETLCKPKHNTLNYSKVPTNNFVLFGIKNPSGIFQDCWEDLYEMSLILGCDVVPLLGQHEVKNKEDFLDLLDETSYLGNEKVEGIVIKNYSQLAVSAFSRECFGKFVSEKFKERNHGEWKPKKEAVADFIQAFKTEARWEKAVQRLRDSGQLENSPRDIGKLCKSVAEDIGIEEEQFAKEWLWKHFSREIRLTAVSGIAEWYKSKLLEKQFNGG